MPARAFPKVPVEPSKAPESNHRHEILSEPPRSSWGRVVHVDLGLFSRRRPVVVGIDQSLENFGLAAYSPEDGAAFLWLFHPGDHGVRRLFNIHSFVSMTMQQIILRCGEPVHVAMEGYSFGSFAGREKMGECGATVKMALVSSLGICKPIAFPTLVAPQQVKKFATGRGNAKKNEMLLAVYKKWGVDLTDDNLCDAYTLARVAAAVAAGAADLEYEKAVIGALERNTEWAHTSTPRKRTRSSTKARRASSG